MIKHRINPRFLIHIGFTQDDESGRFSIKLSDQCYLSLDFGEFSFEFYIKKRFNSVPITFNTRKQIVNFIKFHQRNEN